MPNLELTIEQVITLVQQLPTEGKYAVLSALNAELNHEQSEPDIETNEWLEADLADALPPYEWGAEGIPKGKKVHYVPGTGLVVKGGKPLV